MDQPTRINDEMQILWQNGEFVFASRANRKKTYRRWAILCSSFNSDSSNKNAVLFPCVIFLMFPFCGRCSCRDFTRNFVFTFIQLLYSSLSISLLSSTIAVARTVRDANSLLDLHFIIQQNNEQTKKNGSEYWRHWKGRLRSIQWYRRSAVVRTREPCPGD